MSNAKPLTSRQREVLDALIRSTDDGRQLGVRELAKHFGWSSHQAAHDHLRALSSKGYIELANKGRRGVNILRNPDRSEYLPPGARYRMLARALGCHREVPFHEVLAAARARRSA